MTSDKLDDYPPYERKLAGNTRIGALIGMTHFFAVVVFSFIAWASAAFALRGPPDPKASWLLITAMACSQITIGIANEIFDKEVDSVSKPWRAIPAGHMSVLGAKLSALLFCITGLAIALLISTPSALLLFLGIAVGWSYSAWFKRTRLSWLPYVLCYPLAPVWAWISVNAFEPSQLMIFILATPFSFASHMCNQLRDFDEDAKFGIHNVTHYLGKTRATAVCFLLLAISPIPSIILLSAGDQPRLIGKALIVGAIHLCLTLPSYFKNHLDFSEKEFRSLFKKIQVGGLLLCSSWLQILTIPANS